MKNKLLNHQENFRKQFSNIFRNYVKTFASIAAIVFCLLSFTIAQAGNSNRSSITAIPDSGSGSCLASYIFIPEAGNNFQFISTSSVSSGSVTSYHWNFGDGDTSNVDSVVHHYALGAYVACLTITTSTGCTSYYCDSVYAGICTAGFTYRYAGGNVIDFSGGAKTAYPVTNYSWNFGDGDTSNSTNPSHDYSTAGTYTVTLTITASNGCTANYSATIPVPQPICNPSFTYTVSGDTVNFTSTSTSNGNIYMYVWAFADSTDTIGHDYVIDTTTTPNFQFVFKYGGSYLVNLTIYSDSGCSATVSNFVTIASTSCNASYNYSYPGGDTVDFYSTSTAGYTITGYSWSFGDGSTSTLQSLTHDYSTKGVYDVSLTISTSNGCSSTYSDSIRVPQPICNPSYNYTVSGDTVNFTSNSTTNEGNIYRYVWVVYDSIPDSSREIIDTTTTPNFQFVFKTSGNFPVFLTIYSDSGCTATYYGSVYVIVGCTAGFNYNIVSGNLVDFTSTSISEDSITGYNWDFGDGNTSTAKNPSHDYAHAGVYNITLSITSSTGCTSSYSDSVRVPVPVCNASFTYSVAGDTLTLTSTSTSNGFIYRYDWEINYLSNQDSSGNNIQQIDTSAETISIISPAGTYIVGLTIFSDSGCTAETGEYVYVGNLGQYNIFGYVDCNSTAAYPATVYLIQYDSANGGTLTLDSTTQTNVSGNFTFPNVAKGSYTIKAALDSGAADYSDCLPTYMESALYWDSAQYFYATYNSNVVINMIGGTNLGGQVLSVGLFQVEQGRQGLAGVPNILMQVLKCFY